MATVQTIATTLTADPRPFVRGINVANGSTEEFGKAFARLDAQTKRIGILGGSGGASAGAAGGAGGFASGFQELARGVEDAASVFGTSGFAGAIRASSNNLSQMASVMGGPLAGAIAGFAAAGLSMAGPYIASLFDATEATKKLKEETDKAIKSINELFERREAGNVRGVEFGFELRGIDDSRSARSAIEQRRREARVLEEREFFNRQQREAVFARGRQNGFTPEIQEELNRLDEERLRIQEQQLQTQHEIARLRERERQLLKEEAETQKQKDQSEFAEGIRRMQEEDDREELRNRERQEQEERRGQEQVEGMLRSRLQGLGGNVDPLEGVQGIPDALRGELSGLLGEIDELNKKPRVQFAQVATADSQTLLRAQTQAKDAAERKAQTERLIKRLEDLLNEVKALRKDGKAEADLDDVNLT